jgi:hypothetical protein
MKSAEIAAMAQRHLADHPELHYEAFERACKMGLIDPGDQETLLTLLDLAQYLTSPVAGTESTKSGTENTRDFPALKG